MGYWCPLGTGFDWQPCPHGTFGNETGLSLMDQCEQCLGGFYCDQLGATSVTASCDPGEINDQSFTLLSCGICF